MIYIYIYIYSYSYSYSCSYSHKEKLEDYRNMKENFYCLLFSKQKNTTIYSKIKCSMEEDKLKQDRKESKGK